jgi:hypothetical protein
MKTKRKSFLLLVVITQRLRQVFTTAVFIAVKWKVMIWKWFQAYSTPNYRNVLVSPIGLKLVLALLYEGSGGLTEREFQNNLQFPLDKQHFRENFQNILQALQVRVQSRGRSCKQFWTFSRAKEKNTF